MRLTQSEAFLLQEGTELPRPTNASFGGDSTKLLFNGGGPKRVEFLVSSDNPVTLTNVGVGRVIDDLPEVLTVPGADEVIFTSLQVSPVIKTFVVDVIGRATRLGLFCDLFVGAQVTISVRGVYEVNG